MISNYSDLVGDNLKCVTESGIMLEDGDSKFSYYSHDVIVENYEINHDSTAKALNIVKGKYTLITLPNVHLQNDKIMHYYAKTLSKQLSNYLSSSATNVLIVGLGNRHIMADSLGSKVVGRVDVGVHGNVKLQAIAPSVLGLTGIESSDIVSAIANKINADCIVVIDSLCASSPDRLGSSFQITNHAITPGSGVSNCRPKITHNNVVSIGVPLMVYSNTYVRSALTELGIKNYKLTNTENHIVTPKDIDIIVDVSATIIAIAINMIYAK